MIVTGSGRRWIAWAAVGLLATACGGGDDDDPPPPANVTLSGTVTYDFVPVTGAGLNYAQTQPRPVRGATVEIVSGTTVLAATKTNASGVYSVAVPSNQSAFVRVKAQLQQTGAPSFNFRVLDNTSGNALYALDGSVSSTGTVPSVRNLHAPSGWGGSSYSSERAAAPFAILDTVYEAVSLVLAADASASFLPLDIHWSVDNRPVLSASGSVNPATGEIGTSFASVELGGLFLLGDEDTDTEEYDRHVITHEWGHYFEFAFARTDNIGGPHTRFDQLDLRTAFSEGFSNALSAIVLNDSVYRDTAGDQQGQAFGFDIEGGPPNPAENPGWYSEESVSEIVYDIVDSAPDGADLLDLEFAAVLAVLSGAFQNSVALTSIFSFIDPLKASNPASAAGIDALVNAQSITSVADAYGGGETNDAGTVNDDVLPVYAALDVNGPAVNLCSTDEFRSAGTGMTNKLGSRRFARFSVPVTATYTLMAAATSIPAGEIADPDLVLHQAGIVDTSDGAPTANCSSQTPANCIEAFSQTLTPGDYVLEVYEFTNTESDDSPFPPIGRTCFDVRITQP